MPAEPPSPPQTATAFAPGRVNLMGEHTDYNGGRCLPIAIGLGVTAQAARRHDATWEFTSSEFPAVDDTWKAYPRAVVAALSDAGITVPHASVRITSTLPAGAGLSSSAALECAVAVALTSLAGIPLDADLRRQLVQVCRSAENDYVGAPTGGLDQTTVMLAEPHSALVLDFTTGEVRPIGWAANPPTLLVIDTRTSHALADGGGYSSRVQECRAAAEALAVPTLSRASGAAVEAAQLPEPLARRTRHVLTENARVDEAAAALQAGHWSELGAIFHASHASLRHDYEVSAPELDLAVQAACDGGALGARMTGGGFGGSAVALVEPPRLHQVRHHVMAAFEQAGAAEPALYEVAPAPGARMLEPPSFG